MPPRKAAKKSKPKPSTGAPTAKAYDHAGKDAPIRPDVGLQSQFRQRKPPEKYRYDPSLDPQLSWDVNPVREEAEALIRELADTAQRAADPKATDAPRADAAERARAAATKLRKLSQPFLNWAGKAEHQEIEVPTLPLFVHERLSTKAILESVEGRKPQKTLKAFFADPELDVTDRALKAYTHKDRWANRMILGDSLVVMNSLLRYEGMAGQVQMIYIDPPYGVKFGSNFQPFIRNRKVDHGRDQELTREPEMVQAYRDTWELGLHSYLSYLRDRLLLARELLTATGSIFIQINDENLHLIRTVAEEVFGKENDCGMISFAKTTGQTDNLLGSVNDYLIWFAKDISRQKFRRPWNRREAIEDPTERYVCVETREGQVIDLSVAQKMGKAPIPEGRILKLVDTSSQTGTENSRFEYEFNGKKFRPQGGRGWSTSREGLDRLSQAGRLHIQGSRLWWKAYRDEFPYRTATRHWDDTRPNAFGDEKLYVVQTNSIVIQRCLLMTTDPGDIVLDPTCGSGTTAYVAEQWGRRWLTIDTSRVPLALARQRLLTATFPYYELRDERLGPSSGFVYKRKQNKRGEEVGGIVPHVTLKSIAQGIEPEMEVLVDRPEVVDGVVRVAGPFAVEATIPAPTQVEPEGGTQAGPPLQAPGDYIPRMLEILRRSPILRLPGGNTVEFRNLRSPARALDVHAIADVDTSNMLPGGSTVVAIVFGPENGAVTEQLIVRAAKEANAKNYSGVFVIGFAIQDAASKLLKNAVEVLGIPVTYAQATMDILMGDLLKTTRSSQLFSVTGLPDVEFVKLKKKGPDGEPLYQVRLHAVDTFDPITMEPSTLKGDDVPAWMLDADYDELCFRANQVFFPRTGAWENLKRALKGVFNDSLWDHLAGTESEAFALGEHKRVAIKAIDERGNELLVVKDVSEAVPE